jgi:TFIIH p62 subunit, N-terminal domain
MKAAGCVLAGARCHLSFIVCLPQCVRPRRLIKKLLASWSSPKHICNGSLMERRHRQCEFCTRKQPVSCKDFTNSSQLSADITTRLIALFCSKEGAAQIRLKLGLVGDDTGHNFTFTSPQSVAYKEREIFKKELTNIISRNRSVPNVITPRPPLNTSISSTPAISNAPTPRSVAPPSRASASRAPSVSSDGRTPIVPGSDPTSDFRLRKQVLVSNPELGALHRDLVMSGQITEAEFWEGREVRVGAS